MSATMDVPQLGNLVAAAGELLRSGRLSEAQASYRAIVLREPGQVEALRALSYLALKGGDAGEARDYARRAVEASPGDARLWVGLGRLCRQCEDEAGALEAYEKAVALQPGLADAWISLGVVSRAKDPQRAIRCYERVLELEPGNAGALVNLSNVLLDLGHEEQAEQRLRAGLERMPGEGVVLMQLGKMLGVRKQVEEAAGLFRRAMALEAFATEAAVSLAMLEQRARRYPEAVELLRFVERRAPDDVMTQVMLGQILYQFDDCDGALAALNRAIALAPDNLLAHQQASDVYRRLGEVGASVAAARRALELDPESLASRSVVGEGLWISGDAAAALSVYEDELLGRSRVPPWLYGNRLMILNYHARATAEEISRAHREVEGRMGLMERKDHRSGVAAPGSRDKRLRIGYVSADFRDHSVSYFVEPVWSCRDREAVEVVGYFNNVSGDEVTGRLRAQADEWVECGEMSDDALVKRIEEDRIDILVDLSGHTGGNRLGVFARKAAPVQMTWLGYPTSTGLSAIDYRLSDWEVDPEGWERYSVEELVRMPGSYYCYRPPVEAPEVGGLPARETGQVSFVSFNNLAKIGDEVLALWGRILEAVPGSRLVLKARTLRDEGVRKRMLERLAGVGIGAERVHLNLWAAQAREHLGLYGEVDIGLDTWPYNGATTTCEALWMGVPVVTLKGETHAGRMGASLLKAAGLGEWVSQSGQAYVDKAVSWAGRLEELSELRAGMRERLRDSVLLDEEGFTRALEAAYRRMWVRWCEGASATATG